jgi:hypothetical protein
MERLRPNLFVIGAMKSGTTSLHSYLAAHPQVFMSTPKEPRFFTKENVSSDYLEWYLQLFAPANEAIVVGESTTEYSRAPRFPGVPGRIARFNPDARFIYVMRDPVERAISQYWFHVRFCGERRDMLTAIREDAQYTDASNYAMQLNPYLELFGLDKIATLTFEDLCQNTRRVVQNLFRWLGVDSSLVPPNLDQRENVTPRNIILPKTGLLNHIGRVLKPAIPPRIFSATKRLLQRYEHLDRNSCSVREVLEFLQPIQQSQVARLEEILGRSFPEWTTLYGNSTPAGPPNTA